MLWLLVYIKGLDFLSWPLTGTDNIDIVLNEIDALVNVDFDARKSELNLTRLNLLRLEPAVVFKSM